MKAFKYRLYPTKQQEKLLFRTLTLCRKLYNAALQERRDAYHMAGISINYSNQSQQLPDIKLDNEEYQSVHSQVLQDVLARLDKAMKSFFRRVKNAENPGYPRFRGRNRYNSFTYPQKGYSLTHDNCLCLSKIGSIKVKLHHPIEGTIKTCTVKYEAGSWYIVFSCEVDTAEPLPPIESEIGIDLGITHFAALSDGTFIESPRYFRRSQKKLAKLQQALSRKKQGSHRREKARKAVARAHRKIKNQRRDFHHKASRKLVNEHQVIVLEDLQIENLTKRPKPKQDEAGNYQPNGAAAKSGLNKSILDAGWASFQQMVTYKAECAGRTALFVNPQNTSQVCSQCGAIARKELSERWHSCECGCELDRDTNAANNILRLGRSQRGATCVEAPAFYA